VCESLQFISLAERKRKNIEKGKEKRKKKRASKQQRKKREDDKKAN
jgi:hypothetical protein